MRHRKAKGKLGRSLASRIRLLRKLITDLVDLNRIETTVSRAKAVAPIANKLMQDAFENSPESRERILSLLYRKELALKVFGEMRERYATFGRIPPTTIWLNGFRKGDHMPKAIVEFVDAPWDIRKTLNGFAKEKGLLGLFEDLRVSGKNPLDRPSEEQK